MKSLMQLWQQVLTELGDLCGTCTTLDFKTAERRFEHEGLSFLTITLPNFAKDLQKGLDEGKVGHDLFLSFSKTGGLPRFLGGFLDLVFERGSGLLLDKPSIEAIYALRQLTLMFGKLSIASGDTRKAAIACSDERTKKAIDDYVLCEKEVRQSDSERTQSDYLEFSRLSTHVLGDVLSRCDLRIYRGEHVPRHGPGATADKLKGNRKFVQTEWPRRLEFLFPALDFIVPGYRYWKLLDCVNYLEPGAERPVRVITVPKTLKTPRIIAIEPTAMQYAQQSLLELFLDELKRDDILSQLIRFDDQTPNQRLARLGSIDGSLATLDLSEASDRVSNQLVRAMLARFPHFAEGVDACRSRKADVPGHGVIRLAKFASMGSALCFPIEAMVFLIVVLLGIQDELSRPLTRRDLEKLVGQVCIFGDDIIVPVRYVPTVVRRLENFGFKVNASKSYWTGRFRESCGKDYYAGSDVSVARCRSLIPAQRQHVEEIVSTVSLRNQLYQLGLEKTCQWLDEHLGRILRYYPTVSSTSSVLGRHHSTFYQVDKMDVDLHRPLVRGYVVTSRLPVSHLDGEYALLKWFLKRGDEPYDEGHLERAGRPDAVTLKLRWTTPY